MIRENAFRRFPLLLAFLAIIAVFSGYHGYSYDCFLSAVGAKMSPVWGKSRCARSDDWAVNFPIQISQVKSVPPFPVFNSAVGGGESMDLLPPTAPTRSIWTIFKPNLWGFFIDLDTGISWEWVFGATSLLLSSFLLLTQVLKVPEFESVLLACTFYFSPFFQFWSLAPVLHCTYFFSMVILISSGVRTMIKSLLLSYLIVAWALLLYPPFQVPLLLLLFIFTIVHLQFEARCSRTLAKREFCFLVGGGILAIILLSSWYFAHQREISLITHTVYPGKRQISGGALTLTQYFGNSIFSLRHAYPSALGANLSEAAGFIQWVPFLFVLLCFARSAQRHPLFLSASVFMFIIAFYQIIGLPNPIASITLLSMTTENRSVIGTGLINFIFIGLIISQRSVYSRRLINSISGIFLVIGVFFNYSYFWHSPYFFAGISVTLLSTTVIYFLFKGWNRSGLLIYFLQSLILGGYYNPITLRGSEKALSNSAVFQNLEKLKATSGAGAWIALENFTWGNVPRAIAVKSYGGVHLYPDFSLWEKLDPQKEYENIWNRFAHVVFRFTPLVKKTRFTLEDPNSFSLDFGTESGVLAALRVSVLLAPCFTIDPLALSSSQIPVGMGQCAFQIRGH